MVPYGGKNKPVRFSVMWETVVGSKKPIRYMHKKSRMVVCKQPYGIYGYVNVRCLLEARTVLQGEVPTGWVGNTVRCIGP